MIVDIICNFPNRTLCIKGSLQAKESPDVNPTINAHPTKRKHIAKKQMGLSGYRNLEESTINVKTYVYRNY